jgi:hypothetical protein
MKQVLTLALVSGAFLISSFHFPTAEIKLYPKIETYFNTLDLSKKRDINSDVLNLLKNNIELSDIDYRHDYLLSGDNADAAAFVHIILYSWIKAKKFNKIDLQSCSNTQTISEQGIQALKDIGYNVEKKDAGYLISFSENIKPLKLSIFACTDKKVMGTPVMKLTIRSDNSNNEKSSSILHYSQGDSKEMFASIATDLFSVIQIIKK